MEKGEYMYSKSTNYQNIHNYDKSLNNTFVMLKDGKHLSQQLFDCEKSTLQQYRCKNCDYSFDNVVHLKKHIEEHRADEKQENYILKSYFCRCCHFRTYSSLLWIKHTTIHKSNMKKHFIAKRTTYNGVRCFKCENCDYKSLYKFLLKRHFFSKHDKTRLKCKECAFKTIEKASLSLHFIQKHVRDEDKIWLKCEKCMYKTLDKACLRKHFLKKHVRDEDKTWLECEKCTYKTSEKESLNNHFFAKHARDEDKKWLKCEKCPYVTSENQNLTNHFLANHVRDEDKNWIKCKKCSYKTLKKGSLTRHVFAKHVRDEKTWYNCEICIYKTTYKGSLKKHFKTKHASDDDKKWFKSKKCNYKNQQTKICYNHLNEDKKRYKWERPGYKSSSI